MSPQRTEAVAFSHWSLRTHFVVYRICLRNIISELDVKAQVLIKKVSKQRTYENFGRKEERRARIDNLENKAKRKVIICTGHVR